MYILICAAVFLAAYLLNTTLIGPARGQSEDSDEVRDLEFEISALNRKGLWHPASAKFSYQSWEVDLGFGIAVLLEKLGVLEIERALLIPSRAVVPSGFAHA